MRLRTLIVLFLTGIIFCFKSAYSQSVGSVDGVFNVSDMGSGTYSIPIKVPEGIGGIKPGIAINYNSQGGNGILGIGWTLSCGSAITRTGNTIYNDKKVTGIGLTADDKYNLDGNRLILTGGTYGAPASSYHTEVESFKDITANGSLNNTGPLSFSVKDLDGNTYEYGLSASSRISMPGINGTCVWLLDKITDLKGNYVQYTYAQSAGEEPRILYITYSDNNTTGDIAKTTVFFYYEAKPDPNFSYIAGGKLTQTYRLQSIVVRGKDQTGTAYTFRSYAFEYTTDVYTHLMSITEKGNEINGSQEVLPKTEFTYGAVETPSNDVDVHNIDNGGAFKFISLDYNGDGRSDVIRIPTDYNATNDQWTLFKNEGNGFSFAQSGTLPVVTGNDPSRKYESITSRWKGISVFDFNGDGKDDIIFREKADYNDFNDFRLYLSNGNGLTLFSVFFRKPNGMTMGRIQPFSGDFDGDGKTEVLAIGYSNCSSYIIGEQYLTANTLSPNGYTPFEFSAPFNMGTCLHEGVPYPGVGNPTDLHCEAFPPEIYVIDYNGDGKSDIMFVKEGVTKIYEMNVTFDANNKPVPGSPLFKEVSSSGYPSVWHDIAGTGDFNGDGITDILTYYSSASQPVGWEIGYGNGKGNFNISPNHPALGGKPNNGVYRRPIIIADFNGDGKSDIYNYAPSVYSSIWGYTPPQIHYSIGNDLFSVENLNTIEPKVASLDYAYCIGDFSGDGSVDFITKFAQTSGSLLRLFRFHPYEKRHLITKIKNGLGSLTSVNYESLAFSAAYSMAESNTYVYPYIRRTISFKIVTAVTSDNGIDNTGNVTTYSYSGLKFNAQGKGLLGFDKVASFDQASSIKKEKTFVLNTTYAYPYMEREETSYNPNANTNTLLNKITNTYGVYAYPKSYLFPNDLSLRIFPYTIYTQQTDYVKNEKTEITSNYLFYTPTINGGDQGATGSNYTGQPLSIVTNKGNGLEVTTQTFSYPWRIPTNAAASSGEPYSGKPFVYAKPYKITTATVRQGEAPYTRIATFNYNDNTGLLDQSISDPNTANAVTANFEYDAYGNLTRKLETSPGLPNHDSRMAYDPFTHIPIVESYNAAYPDIRNKASFHPVFGYLLTSTNPDGFKKTYKYDGFGRVKTATDNNGLSVTTSYNWGSNTPGSNTTIQNAQYNVGTVTNTGAENYIIYDRLGRTLVQRDKNFQNKIVAVSSTYNNKGQLFKTTKPYIESLGIATQNVTNSYDTYGRLTLSTAPEGNTTIGYSPLGLTGLTITSTNPAAQTQKVKMDVSGRKIQTTDNSGNLLDYKYHSNGNVKSVVALGTTLQTYSYDDFARLKERWDPNYGTYAYNYNAYGQQIYQKDPKSHINTYFYDALGRLISKNSPEDSYLFGFFNNAGPNCGKLTQIGSNNGTITYEYGMGDKVNSIDYDDNGTSLDVTGSKSFPYKTSIQYDAYGRIDFKYYATGALVNYGYSSFNGDLVTINDYKTGNILYEKKNENNFGQVTAYSQTLNGNTVATTQNYDNLGYLKEQITTGSMGDYLRYYKYDFDITTGNMTGRRNVKYSAQENFGYDGLNRLNHISHTLGSGYAYTQLEFAENGNIKKKTDAGDFTYDQANRLSEVKNFQNIPTVTQNVDYTSFDKVSHIAEGGYETDILYGPDEERSMMFTPGVSFKSYAPDMERELSMAHGDRTFTYIRSPQGNVVAIMANESGMEKDYLVLTDHLGSFTHIVDVNGNVVEEKSYDAWGRLRNPESMVPYASNLATGQPSFLFDRGYTGHEHLPVYGIINMNGRLYDPVMGRMFSPDVNIIGADNIQGYNRYSYALNNPLKYTDPDGNTPAFANLDINWNRGLSVGATLGIGYRGLLSAQLSLGYDFGAKDFYGYVGGTAAGFTLSGGGGFNSGFSLIAGYEFQAGMGRDLKRAMHLGNPINNFNWAAWSKANLGADGLYAQTGGEITYYRALDEVVVLSGKRNNIWYGYDPDRPEGTMSLSQANKWAHIGNGKGVYIDFTKIVLPSTVTVERFDNSDFMSNGNPGIYVRFDGKDFANPNQAAVYGTIGVVLIDKNTVWALPDTYDFDIKNKSGTFYRDIGTKLGSAVSEFGWITPGKGFPIYFTGYQTIPRK